MRIKYKCFWFEKEEDNNFVHVSVYYNGTCCTTIKRLSEDNAILKAKQWVDNYGYEWLGFEQ